MLRRKLGKVKVAERNIVDLAQTAEIKNIKRSIEVKVSSLRFLFAFFPLFIGCHSKQIVIKNFETTDSMCMDAVLIELAMLRCDTIISKTFSDGVYLRCDSIKDKGDTSALDREYFITPPGSKQSDIEAMPVCIDSSVMVLRVDTN